ncbi:hypothetical protein Zmor_001861 [Zophobas morio]|uniref:Transposable element P transposase-like GTP-binding insertion domain-containing protein n=1 Tax=Zophobas morio TaxID=2755281 RepID=A0AA38JA40_9CUCU|nr:hypothetical protein Zmor_001861 [Zophobas morio]
MDSTRLCPKLTDRHIFPEKMNKMKVSLMAQVFSFKVGSLMKRISQWGLQCDNSLPAEAVQTADFILFMDMLFDSLNGNTKQAPDLSSGVLDNLHCFLTGDEIEGVHPLEENSAPEVPSEIEVSKKSRVAEETIAYFAGFVAKKISKITNQCAVCQQLMSYSDGNVPLDHHRGEVVR